MQTSDCIGNIRILAQVLSISVSSLSLVFLFCKLGLEILGSNPNSASYEPRGLGEAKFLHMSWK